MLSGHMPGGAQGILSLITVVFVLPEGKSCCLHGAGCACALELTSFASSSTPGVIYLWDELGAFPLRVMWLCVVVWRWSLEGANVITFCTKQRHVGQAQMCRCGT